tara:strand:+ start:372 stop:521 length:150 start_codon:yes stop_codon:yes gene_type:complete
MPDFGMIFEGYTNFENLYKASEERKYSVQLYELSFVALSVIFGNLLEFF